MTGIRHAMPVDREVFEFQVWTLERLVPGSTWTGSGTGRHRMEVAAWSLALGGRCRTGRDKVRLDRDRLAPRVATERVPDARRGRALSRVARLDVDGMGRGETA